MSNLLPTLTLTEECRQVYHNKKSICKAAFHFFDSIHSSCYTKNVRTSSVKRTNNIVLELSTSIYTYNSIDLKLPLLIDEVAVMPA